MKKGFLRIAASLLASASLMVSVAIPASAEKGRFLKQIFPQEQVTMGTVFPEKSKNGNVLTDNNATDVIDSNLNAALQASQTAINTFINNEVNGIFQNADHILINDYKLTKDRYIHIAFGNYGNGLHDRGLHMECGLRALEAGFKVFKEEIEKSVKSTSESEKLKSLKNWLDSKPTAFSNYEETEGNLVHCKINFSDANYVDERYLFPKNWNDDDLKTALTSAIDEKEAFEKELKEKFASKIDESKDEDFSNMNKDKLIDKLNHWDLEKLNEEYTKQRLKAFREKMSGTISGEGFPNLYGYANNNNKSMSLHILDDPKNKGQKICVQLIVEIKPETGSKEIVSFYPINVQGLKDKEYWIVENENKDDSFNVFDIFRLEQFNSKKQFLKRTAFRLPKSPEDNGKVNFDRIKKSIDSWNKNVLRSTLNKFINLRPANSKSEDMLKNFKKIVGDIDNSNKIKDYVKQSQQEQETKKLDFIFDTKNCEQQKDNEKSDKNSQQLLQDIRSKLQELSDRDKIFTDICPNWNSNDSLKDEDLKKFILKTALKEMKRAYGRIQSSLAQIKDSKNSKNNGDASKKIAARRESAISTNRDIISKNIELIQSGIGALLEKNLDTNYELIPDEIDLLNNLEIGEDELKEKLKLDFNYYETLFEYLQKYVTKSNDRTNIKSNKSKKNQSGEELNKAQEVKKAKKEKRDRKKAAAIAKKTAEKKAKAEQEANAE